MKKCSRRDFWGRLFCRFLYSIFSLDFTCRVFAWGFLYGFLIAESLVQKGTGSQSPMESTEEYRQLVSNGEYRRVQAAGLQWRVPKSTGSWSSMESTEEYMQSVSNGEYRRVHAISLECQPFLKMSQKSFNISTGNSGAFSFSGIS